MSESEELLKAREKKAKLEKNRFKQQTLPAWRPVPTLVSSLITFLVFGVIFLTLGIVLVEFSKDIQEVSIQYHDTWKGKTSWTINFSVDKKMDGIVYVYYELDNFYQNHRRYVKSRDYYQLKGDIRSYSDISDCDPIMKNSDLYATKSYGGTTLTSSDVANPCGLIAKKFF